MTASKQPQPLPQKHLFRQEPPAIALRGAMLADTAARSTLRDPEAGLQVRDRPATPLRGQKFPRATSLSMSLSSSLSASKRFRRAFSFSSCFSRTTSSGRIALNCARQR